MTFKCVHDLCPSYLTDPITFSIVRNCVDLAVPTSNKSMVTERLHFAIAGPQIWNALPRELRATTSVDIFKKNLKTYFIMQVDALYTRLNMK